MPYPPNDGGAIATLNMIKGLAKFGDEVTVLAMQTHKHSFSVNNLPKDLTKSINWFQVYVNTKLNPIKAFLNLLFSTKPYNAVRFKSNNFEKKVKNLLLQSEYDIIQLEGLYLYFYVKTIREFSNAKIVLRAHNIEHEIWYRLAINEKFWFKKRYLNQLSKRIKKLEFKLLKKVDLLVPITKRDSDVLKMNIIENVFVSPTGIEESKFESVIPKYKQTLFYIGALDWIPNQEALRWFLTKVWNDIKNEFPTWEFVIAGRNAPYSFENELNSHSVNYIGEVEDATKFIDENNIMIVPLLSGSGMRIKIIEGMARGKCILTTSIGAEGISAENGKSIFIQDTALDFKRVLKKIIQNQDLIENCGKNAFIFVKQNYNNHYIINSLREFYNKHI